jgi:hypothetical protein
MNVILEPVLADCRAIYDLEDVMERYWAYVDLMTKKRGELLPLGAFSPMGKRQKDFLDDLLALEAEDFAAKICKQASQELESDAVYRVMLVVVDEPRNGWTQRYLTDADWRFPGMTKPIPKNSLANGFDRWVSVQLWTTEFDGQTRVPTLAYVRQETRAALARAEYQRIHGYPITLKDMMLQEGTVMTFSGEEIDLEPDDLKYSQAILEPLLNSTDYPTNFAAMYGDEAAISVGFPPLGLSSRTGFALSASIGALVMLQL